MRAVGVRLAEGAMFLAIRERLAKSDPADAGWQRDLSVSYERIGDALIAQGSLPDALRSYCDGLTIRERLAKSDPGNAGWQRNLSVSYNKVGYALVAQGRLPEALQSYHDGLAIRERLAKIRPRQCRLAERPGSGSAQKDGANGLGS